MFFNTHITFIMFFNETRMLLLLQLIRMHVTNLLLPKFFVVNILLIVSLSCEYIMVFFIPNILFHRSFRHWHLNLIRNPNLTLRIQILDNDHFILLTFIIDKQLFMPFYCNKEVVSLGIQVAVCFMRIRIKKLSCENERSLGKTNETHYILALLILRWLQIENFNQKLQLNWALTLNYLWWKS